MGSVLYDSNLRDIPQKFNSSKIVDHKWSLSNLFALWSARKNKRWYTTLENFLLALPPYKLMTSNLLFNLLNGQLFQPRTTQKNKTTTTGWHRLRCLRATNVTNAPPRIILDFGCALTSKSRERLRSRAWTQKHSNCEIHHGWQRYSAKMNSIKIFDPHRENQKTLKDQLSSIRKSWTLW